MNIYVDIDGVILANDKEPARYVKKFLKYITNNYPTYWLTTHCKGDAEYTVNHLSRWLDKKSLALAKRLKATNWDTAKTEAIDFNSPFLWFDDYVFDFEKEILKKHDVLKNWVEVDLSKNKNQLKDIVRNLKKGVYDTINNKSIDSFKDDMCELSFGDNTKFKNHGLDKWAPLNCKIEYDLDDFNKIKEGYHRPERGMDERWHIYYKDSWLYFNRSWTGWCQFKIKFEKIGERFYSTEAFKAGDEERIESDEVNNFSVDLIKELIDRYLLGNK